MIAELVTTGSELLLGQVVNTNAAWLAAELNRIGFDVRFQTTVGDNRERMEAVLRHALGRADIVITSGGLGPTRGDITKEVSAAVFGRRLVREPSCVERLEAHFARMGRKMTENNLRQAMIPEGAHILVNYAGTAPGVVMEQEGKLLVNLPGPPSELRDMFERSLKPYFAEKCGLSAVIRSRVLNTSGIGESMLETRIDDLILAQGNPTLALLVRPEGVIIRITAKTADESAALALIEPVEREIRARVGEYIYAVDDEPIEAVVGRELLSRSLTVAAAESCTGGLVTSRLTDVAGSSAYVRGAVVSYTDEVKAGTLGVDRAMLCEEGAVSEPVARAMAESVRRTVGADIGIGVTGLAGPGGGTETLPVGTVYVAVADDDGTTAEKHIFGGSRRQVKYRASQAALTLLWKTVRERAVR